MSEGTGLSSASGFRPHHNLPLQLTSFVGREREMAEVERLLRDHRLVTLTGPGGSGKTRLALAVASEMAQRFEDGVWLVELAPISDPNLVPQAVASVLVVREAPGTPLVNSLLVHLESRRTLLVLDNCEHLVEAVASLSEVLLRRCPDLRILATSREALGLTGETLFAVSPLSLPDPRRLMLVESAAQYEATRLFVERAKAVKPNFTLTRRNAAAVGQICHRLDGIPLAIELAAAKVRVLSAEQICERLEESFRLLTGGDRTVSPHHRTLRATMDWSYELLSREERTLCKEALPEPAHRGPAPALRLPQARGILQGGRRKRSGRARSDLSTSAFQPVRTSAGRGETARRGPTFGLQAHTEPPRST